MFHVKHRFDCKFKPITVRRRATPPRARYQCDAELDRVSQDLFFLKALSQHAVDFFLEINFRRAIAQIEAVSLYRLTR